MAKSNDIHYVFVCQGKNCLIKGSRELLQQLQANLGHREGFKVVPFICFGACTASPNVVVFPDRLWYSTVALKDIGIVVECILRGENLPELSGQVSTDLKNLVFRLFGHPPLP